MANARTTAEMPEIATGAPPKASPAAGSPWIYTPWLDLLIGCGGWSAPLLLVAWIAAAHAREWSLAFYSLALTAILAHANYRFVPWIFTLYIDWSPWHYSGQNFGLLMMFTRRTGVKVTSAERRLLQIAFIASYVMLLVSFHTGASNDPLILSLGIPEHLSAILRAASGTTFLLLGCWVFANWISRSGFRAMAAPLTLLLSQFLWFLLPTALELVTRSSVPQTRYSSGILAVLHSTQYLWITSYYARKEARAAGNVAWRLPVYFATLIAGGVGLFIAGPWLVSYTFHYDFTVSFLIFTALVNIHHFLLDGAIWKLRDTRIASFLVDRSERRDEVVGGKASSWLGSRSAGARASRIGIAAALVLLGGLDVARYFAATDEGNLTHLARAASLNPYDSSLELRIARADEAAGKNDDALAAVTRAASANPSDPAPLQERARILIATGKYQEAYAHYQKMLAAFPNNIDALVNYGLLAARLGHSDEATSSWEKAITIDPSQANAQLYLAEMLTRGGKYAAAIPHFEAFLSAAPQVAADSPAARAELAGQRAAVEVELGDAYAETRDPAKAAAAFRSAAAIASEAHEARFQSLALAHMADALDAEGQARDAAQAFQQSLAIDLQLGDSQSAAVDWFNYGQFLARQHQPMELAYACYLRAEELLKNERGASLEAVSRERAKTEASLGIEAERVKKNLGATLAQAQALPPSAFTSGR
jgi:tetratricopeptide (TPR) repeat protein